MNSTVTRWLLRAAAAVAAVAAVAPSACGSSNDRSKVERGRDGTVADASAPPTRISSPGGDVTQYQMPAESGNVVVYAQAAGGGTDALFSSPADRSAPQPAGKVASDDPSFWLGPVGRSLLFVTASDASVLFDLASKSTSPVAPAGAYGMGSTVAFAPDGSSVALTTSPSSGPQELIGVATGTASPKPRVLAKTEAFQQSLPFTPDSENVLFATAQSSPGELAKAPVSGGAVTDLAQPEGLVVVNAIPSPDGKWVTYETANPAQGDLAQAWTVPLAGGKSQLLGESQWETVTPDGERVVFTNYEGQVNILYSTAIDGSTAPTQIGGTDQDAEDDDAILISPDGKYVVYYATVEDRGSIWVTAVDGESHPTLLSGDVDVAPECPVMLAGKDNPSVVFAGGGCMGAADEGGAADPPPAAEKFTMYSAPVTAVSAEPLPLTDASPKVANYVVRPQGDIVAYAGQTAGGPLAMFTVAVTGAAAPTQVSTGPGDANEPQFTPDGGRLLYVQRTAASAPDAGGDAAADAAPYGLYSAPSPVG